MYNYNMIKKIAAITMARNDEFFVKRWIAYYGELFGTENLYLYLDGLDQKKPSGAGRTNIEILAKTELPRLKFDKWRADFISKKATELFNGGYDIVIATDSDEFIFLDPNTNMSLPEYLSHIKINGSVSALGLDVTENIATDKKFDPNRTFLEQRRYAMIHTRMTKANIISHPSLWGSGWHRVKGHNLTIDPNLYMLHMGNVDYDKIKNKASNRDSTWTGHIKRKKLRIFDIVANKRAKEGDTVFNLARKIQAFVRPPYAWNKPAMLGIKWVVKLPARFKGV
jgi:hypothetical protein